MKLPVLWVFGKDKLDCQECAQVLKNLCEEGFENARRRNKETRAKKFCNIISKRLMTFYTVLL